MIVCWNAVLALLSQYACCHMGFLIVRIVGNINRPSGPMSMPKIKGLGPTVVEGEAGTGRWTDRRKHRKYIWIVYVSALIFHFLFKILQSMKFRKAFIRKLYPAFQVHRFEQGLLQSINVCSLVLNCLPNYNVGTQHLSYLRRSKGINTQICRTP